MPQTENSETDQVNSDRSEQDTQQDGVEQDLRLGELGPFDYSAEPFLELTDEEKNAVKKLIRDCSKRDTAVLQEYVWA
jgi:hypothetical protein